MWIEVATWEVRGTVVATWLINMGFTPYLGLQLRVVLF